MSNAGETTKTKNDACDFKITSQLKLEDNKSRYLHTNNADK